MDGITLCIPTWQSAEFIEKTLTFARSQDHGNLKVLVSVDKSEDDTASICKQHASEDARVRVFEQSIQLGWTKNTNFLLDAVETPYFAIYFHDDVIAPNWISTLHKALVLHPDAGAAYCCVRQNLNLDVGENHCGSVFQRLMQRAVGKRKGSPLRALTRTSIGACRLPDHVSTLGYHAQQGYLTSLLARAPMIYVPEPLYQRWSGREGGVTDSWRTLDPAVISSDIHQVVATIETTLAQYVSDERELDILRYATGQMLQRQFFRNEASGDYRLAIDNVGLFNLKLSQNHRSYLGSMLPEYYQQLEELEKQVRSLSQKRSALRRGWNSWKKKFAY